MWFHANRTVVIIPAPDMGPLSITALFAPKLLFKRHL
jgi:hypothetical protein